MTTTNEIRYFSPKCFKNSKIFRTFADDVGKTPQNSPLHARARVFSARKDSEKSVYDKLYEQLSTLKKTFSAPCGSICTTAL